MLILPHRKLLGDGPNGENLRNDEALAYLHHKNERDLKHYRWGDQEEMTDCQRRIGQRMHHSELARRVKRLNPAIFYEQSINFPDSLGFYHLDPMSGKKTYLSSFDKVSYDIDKAIFDQGPMPEFSFMLVDHQNIPEQEVRGWRTVLVRLLTLNALSWQQVDEEFGDPINDLNARRWYAETKQFRY
jgi:hypothetical protein